MQEAECYEYCLLLALVLRDTVLFSRMVSLAIAPVTGPDRVLLSRLNSHIQKVSLSDKTIG